MISNSSIRKVMNNKNIIRNTYKSIVCDKLVTSEIFSLIDSLKIKSICIYSPFPNEIKIDNLVSYLHKENIKIYFPYMRKLDNDFIMEIRKEHNTIFDDYHIKSSDGEKVDYNVVDAYLIPGIAFSSDGFRIGYGKGYYDRLLKDYQGIKIGVCENNRIISASFKESHDISMDFLVTEDRIIGVKHV